MEESWKEYFLLYSDTSEYKERIQEARNIIRDELDDRSYVSCSGGKDSLVLLYLCAQQNPRVHVFHWDHGYYLMPRKIEEEIQHAMQKIAPKAQFHIEVFSFGEEDRRSRWEYLRWYKSFYGTLSTKFVNKYNLDKAFLGLRAEESSKRKIRTLQQIKKKKERKRYFQEEVYPIKDLTWRDVWACIVKNDLPYPSVYDRYAALLGYDAARLVTFHDFEFGKFGSDNIDGWIEWQTKDY
jgi:3'-phosphoadenosine 5'-phosphosulfate sulfotransferase (PAPS reductase)/FAD synthetase